MAGKGKKILLVNRDFQLKYTKAAIAVAIVSTVLSGTVILYPLYIFEILRIPKFLPTPILGAMIAAVIINVGIIAFMGVFLTHKLAGPIYSLAREFRKVGAGIWGHTMSVRPDDDLKFLVRNYNEMAEQMKKICESDIRDLDEVISALAQGNQQPEALQQLQSLQEKLKGRIVGKSINN